MPESAKRPSRHRATRAGAPKPARDAASPRGARAAAPRSSRRASSRRSSASTTPRRLTTLLAVDVGNSETTVGRFRGEVLDGFWRLTSIRVTADELMIQLHGLLGTSHPGAVDAGVISSVVPLLTPAWSEALARLTGTPPVEVDAATA